MLFADRIEAGRLLAEKLQRFAGEDTVVVGLPRGGVPVALEVARALDAPLDVIVVRKLGVPFQPELAMGAVGEGGVRVIDPEVVRQAGVSAPDLAEVQTREQTELERRTRRFRDRHPRITLAGRTVIVIDDGIATGSTARAACRVVRAQEAGKVVLAAPVASPRTAAALREDADEVICLETPEGFMAIGQFYADFSQTTDDEVVAMLDQAPPRARAETPERSGHDTP